MQKFRSFRVEDVAQSLDLIEREIRNFNAHGNTLRIVYE